MKVLLFGDQVADIRPEVEKHREFSLVDETPEIVICYGGDGTLLTAERNWPGIPKVPIRNSLRGNRCIAHPAPLVIDRLAKGTLVRTEFMKLACSVEGRDSTRPRRPFTAMNEVNVHMARINSAVRFKIWIDDEAYTNAEEILGDGFVVSTPFGSTAYFNHITRGCFRSGIGLAFKSTSEHTNHIVVPEFSHVRILITRGPALFTYDNSDERSDLEEGDMLLVERHEKPAVLFTWETMKYPSDQF